MDDFKSIEKKRAQILLQMSTIGGMRQGTINGQYFKRASKKKGDDELRGPYYVLTRKEKGKTVSSRLKGKELEQARAEIENFRRFQKLSREYVELSEKLAQLERSAEDSPEKKRRK